MGPRRRKSRLEGRLGDALRAVAAALESTNVPAMVIGGIAVIARGVPRLTRDVDASVAGGTLSPERLIETFAQHEIFPRIEDAAAFAVRSQVLLLRHAPSGVDVDLSIAWLPFELEALEHREDLELGGIRVPVARAEDLLIYKAVAFRPQDQQDIERLLALHGTTVDLNRIKRVVQEFATAIEAPERPAELDVLIRRTGLA
jgi:predicted nucleotidyltransferase